jgi:hypothetical protein
MWTRRDSRTQFMEAGVRFIAPNAEEKKSIANLIEWCGMPLKPEDEDVGADDDDDDI